MDADWPFPAVSKMSPVSLQRTLARSGLAALGGLVGAYFPCELDPDKPGGEAPFCPTARTTTPRGRNIARAEKSLSSPRLPAGPAPPLAKGDVVRPRRGERWGEEGTVQTVWESSRSDRIEAVVRFKEGGGWFASEDLEFVRSGRPPASLMSRTFSARLPRITASEDAGDSAMLISDLIAGRMTAARKKEIQQRRAAEVQLMRMKEEVRRAAAAERSVEHPVRVLPSWFPCRLFLGPGVRLAARWNRLVEPVKTRKKRGKTGKKWARYGLKGVATQAAFRGLRSRSCL